MPDFTKSELLRFFLVAILGGLFLAQYCNTSTSSCLLVGIIVLFAAIVWRNFWIALFATFLLSANYAHIIISFQENEDELVFYHQQTVDLEGVVTSFPDTREKNTRVFVTTKKGRLLLIVPPLTEVHYGDKIFFTGILERPRNFDNFDYQKYLRRFNVQTIVRNLKQFEIRDKSSGGNILLRWAENVRNILATNLETSIPSPHSSVAMGILLGVKSELPSGVQTDFKNSGLQHLLVVSGFNVTILMVFLSLLLKKFGRRIVFVGTSLSLLFFVAMTGADPPIIRAAIMGTLVGWAVTSGRFSDARNIFLFSIVLMGAWNPLVVQTDIGFFLSSMATLGIILGTPLLEKALFWIPNCLHIRTLLSVTLAAQIAVFPILGIYFGEFPFIGIFSNLVAEPLVPLGMLFSFASSLLGTLPDIVAQILGIPAFVIIETLLLIAQIFGKIPPIPISTTVSFWGLVLILSFFLWGTFSRPFAKKFLTPSKLLDFSCENGKNAA